MSLKEGNSESSGRKKNPTVQLLWQRTVRPDDNLNNNPYGHIGEKASHS